MESAATPSASDILAVKSRVSWGAIFAGAMVAMAIYFLFALLGVATGIEVASRGPVPRFGLGTAIYSILSLLLAMFFGGWTTTRLAVGETKLEAVLHGIVVWGVLFVGLIWLIGNGVRVGFGAVVSTASGAYSTDSGEIDVDRIANDLKRSGVDAKEVDKYRDYARRIQNDPGSIPDTAKEVANSPDVQHAAGAVGEEVRRASWYALAGVAISMLAVIMGALIGSGEVFVPVPILGVKRPPRRPTVA